MHFLHGEPSRSSSNWPGATAKTREPPSVLPVIIVYCDCSIVNQADHEHLGFECRLNHPAQSLLEV